MGTSAPPSRTRVTSAGRWLDVRHRGTGVWAYVANRVTGLVLVGYLYVHLAVLSLLARGPASYDRFVDVMRSPLFLALDLVLIAAWLLHALNGLRLTIVGLGFGVRAQRALLLAVGVATVVALAVAGALLFGG
jgi:succinate dehydrogenase / fumarate reductase cytochrome b subunit